MSGAWADETPNLAPLAFYLAIGEKTFCAVPDYQSSPPMNFGNTGTAAAAPVPLACPLPSLES